jgi:outer membrane receptor protein involved in Fe transport
VTQATVSAGNGKAKGFEFESAWTPFHGANISGGVGYTDFKYTYINPLVLAGNGLYLPQERPKWTANVSGQYETDPIWRDVTVMARVDANWRSKASAVAGVPAITPTFSAAEQAAFIQATTLPAYWLVNARVNLENIKIAGKNASLGIWAQNLLNDKDKLYELNLVAVVGSVYERARTFGVDFSIDF